MTTTQNRFQRLDAATLKQLYDQQAITLVDVREPSEYAGERIPNARLMPLSRFNPDFIANIEGDVVLYCQNGNRSQDAAKHLLMAGFESVMDLEGGLTAWKQQGYPTQINKKAPISIMRQVQIVAGFLVFTGTVLGAFVSPWFLILSGFVGAGLMFAGISGTCMMADLLAKLPYNQIEN